jgi:hypothetical protein
MRRAIRRAGSQGRTVPDLAVQFYGEDTRRTRARVWDTVANLRYFGAAISRGDGTGRYFWQVQP